jgi:hypothetical protein
MDFFNNFDYIFYDEFGTLNPCLSNDLIKNLSDIQLGSKKIFNKNDYKLHKTLESLFGDVKDRIIDSIYIGEDIKLYNRLFKLECDEVYIEKANIILNSLKNKNDDESDKSNLKISSSIMLMLHSIINNKLYASVYDSGHEIVYNILGVNDKIKDFISNYKGKFIVMDATADIVKDVYKYLGIEIYDNFTKNKNKTYEHVTLNIYEFKDVEAKLIRSGEESSLDSISQAIKDRKIISFVPLKIKTAFEKKYGYEIEKVFHFFSGDDVGSNKFRDKTEINIIALQTYPKANRVLYNHIIKGENLESANSSRNDFAEFELLSSHLVQNINRSKSRIYDCEEEININLISVPRSIALKASTFMKGSKVSYKTNLEFSTYNLKSRVLSCLEDYIKSYSYKQVVELDTFLIERGFFQTISEMMNFVEDSLLEINKLTLSLGFEFKVKEETRPYLIKIQRDKIEKETLLKYDNSRGKFLHKIVELVESNIKEIKIKDFKIKYEIKDTTFSSNFSKFESILKDYGVYRIGNSFLFI